MVAGEHLVGALTALHHLDVFRNLLGEQVETDGIVADHGLAHGLHALLKRRQQTSGIDEYPVVVGAEMPGDDVGVFEFVAFFTARRLKAHREGVQSLLPLLGEQTDDEA